MDNFRKLIEVKSIITILFSVVFCVLAIQGRITAEQYQTIFGMVITYYFARKGTQ